MGTNPLAANHSRIVAPCRVRGSERSGGNEDVPPRAGHRRAGAEPGAAGHPADHSAARRFAAIARRAGRELEPATTPDVVVRLADLLPQSATVSVWCESACSTADLVQRLAGCYELLALRADRAAAAAQAGTAEFAPVATSFAVVLA